LINWIYGDKQVGRAVIAVADRMLTAGDIEYEPPQFKIAFLRRRIVLLVSGDITVHSEALTYTQRALIANPEDDIEKVAELYATQIRNIKAQRAANAYLSPLNLGMDSFVTKQKDMLRQVVYDITNQLQGYRLDVEALVIGCNDDLSAHIFHIDGEGVKTWQHDINFAAIGIGAYHAKSQFMFARYPKIINFYRALPILYTAKRRAEVAPGVGKDSDWIIVTRDGWSFVEPEVIAELDTAYSELESTTMDKLADVEKRIEKHFKAKIPQEPAKNVDIDLVSGSPPLKESSDVLN
jgi:20S proteasome alpha/beta subunit